MEILAELLIIAVQFVLEVLVQALVYGGFDLALLVLTRHNKGSAGCLLMVLFLVIGAMLGAAVNYLHPEPFLSQPWMRVANLLLAPPAVGGLSWLVARWRSQQGAVTTPALHFWLAFWFVLGIDLIRLMLAS